MSDITTDFAIVCDDGCDLPAEFLARLGVTVVPLSLATHATSRAEDVAGVYRGLLEAGFARIVSIHPSAAVCDIVVDAHEAASRVEPGAVEVVDTGVASAATGMVVERCAFCRSEGAGFEDAVAAARAFAKKVRLLAVPAAGAPFARRRVVAGRRGLVGRASSLLKTRIQGERGLYVLSDGEVAQLACNTDLIELTSRLAHAMSSVASSEGELVYAKIETGDTRANRLLEKPLDTNEFEARCLGTVNACDVVRAALGPGAVAVALAPAAAYDDPLALLSAGATVTNEPEKNVTGP